MIKGNQAPICPSQALAKLALGIGCILIISACTLVPASTQGLSTPTPMVMQTAVQPVDGFNRSTQTPVSGVWASASDQAASIHSGPGADFPTIAQLTHEAKMPVTGKTADGAWLRLEENGAPGWVYLAAVRVDGDLGAVNCIVTEGLPCESPTSVAIDEAAIDAIRVVTQKPDLQVSFVGINPDPNAFLRQALVY